MRKQLTDRICELREEFKSGQQTLTELEFKCANLKETLLRISGAIQVLEEFLQEQDENPEATHESSNGNLVTEEEPVSV